MNSIWLLQHVHEFDDGHEDVKLIGAYTSEALAQQARKRVFDQPGFRDLPEGFEINEVTLNQDGWVEGFDTYTYPL